MKHQITNLPKNQKKIEVELSIDEFENHVKNTLSQVSKDIKVPGFRPGKVPANIAEKNIDPKHLLEEAGHEAIRQTLFPLAVEQKWPVIGNPEVNIKKIARGSEFIYEAVFSLFPEVILENWKDITIEKKPIAVDEKEVEKLIISLKQNTAEHASVDRPAQKGDSIKMDYEMFVEGLRTEEGKQKTDRMIIGNGLFMAEVEDNLINLKKDESKNFKITYKPDYAQKRFAGKTVEFKVTINDVAEVKLPEENTEWAKKFGDFQDVKQLRDMIKTNLSSEKQTEEDTRLENEAFNKIIERAKFGDIPEILINSESENMLSELKQAVTHQGMEFDKYLTTMKKTIDELKKSFLPQAEKRIKIALIVREIAKQENLKVTKEEVDAEIEHSKEEHASHGHDEDYFNNDEYLDHLENTLLSKKAVNLIKESIIK